MRLFLLLSFYLITVACMGQATIDVRYDSAIETGFEPLRVYITKNIVYPDAAKRAGKQGYVYASFNVDANGKIADTTITILHGFDTSCANEVRQMLTGFPGTLTLRDKESGKTSVTLLIAFKLSGAEALQFPNHTVLRPVEATVIYNKRGPGGGWFVYSSFGFNDKSGSVRQRKQVYVTGWAANTLFIQSDSVTGFVSVNALEGNHELDSIKRLAENEPEELQPVSEEYANGKVYLKDENLRTSLYAPRRRMMIGECTPVTLSFDVGQKNRLKIQFYKLHEQIPTIIDQSFSPPSCIYTNVVIKEIVGVNLKLQTDSITRYPVRQTFFCPTKPGPLVFPLVNLQMLVRRSLDGKIPEHVGAFPSKDLIIEVDPLPIGINVSRFADAPLVGDFVIRESVSQNKLTVGKKFLYSLVIEGRGQTFHIEAPRLSQNNLSAELIEISNADSIVGDDLFTRKKFVYEMQVMLEGIHKFSKPWTLKFYDPKTKSVKSARQAQSFIVSAAMNEPAKTGVTNEVISQDYFIAVDVSQSMRLSDYIPTRINVVKDAVKQILKKHASANIRVILFAGNIRVLNGDNESVIDQLFTLDFDDFISGTAIGDVIWAAPQFRKSLDKPATLLIIGDGDLTAGSIGIPMALTYAKRYGMQVHTIGIGKTGEVPFNNNGQIIMVNNTFTDELFKAVSEGTGGKYYYAEDKFGLSIPFLIEEAFGLRH
ncbi:MAG TPA: VWA domain-containing protein [Chryseosolibacter sp.]|nr:VWA domain-containing protein [Chryseosolibacter sp.]